MLAVVDDFTRECLGLVADTSLSGLRVCRELDGIIELRGWRPGMIVSDNGTKLTSHAIMRWQEERSVLWHYIAPGKPQQNEFNGRFESPLGSRLLLASVHVARSDNGHHRSEIPSGRPGHCSVDVIHPDGLFSLIMAVINPSGWITMN